MRAAAWVLTGRATDRFGSASASTATTARPEAADRRARVALIVVLPALPLLATVMLTPTQVDGRVLF